jgi:hydrogenase/urease accessory protein HupE
MNTLVARLALLVPVLVATSSRAHVLRSAYLEMQQRGPEQWTVLWKVPARDELRLSLSPRFDARCRRDGEITTYRQADTWADRWKLSCAGGLETTVLGFDGLDAGFTDVLVRIVRSDGSIQTARATPASPLLTVEASAGDWEVAATYLRLGVEHILGGVDHLLFILGLLLLVSGWRRLVGTITAFTVAHSITLAAATLGWVQVPQTAVEALIALSIVFVATEVVRAREGRPGLAERWPWVVAFIFGLLHGFGFAGALREVGLPAGAIPVALLFFNLGVELGQVLFVLAVLGLRRLLRPVLGRLPGWAWRVPAYGIGTLACFWVIERTAQFFSGRT